MENFAGLLAFARTVDTGSFAAAARRLGVTASAVGKNVARLEARLGTRLLHRSTRHVRPTEEGLLLHARLAIILEDLADLEATLAQRRGEARGRLRVTLPAIGYRFLLPRLAEFRRLHPAIRLDLDFSDRHVDLVGEGFDVALRGGGSDTPDLVGRVLGRFRFVLCASPSYLAVPGTPATPEDLAQHDCIGLKLPTGSMQAWRFRDRVIEPDAALACSNAEALLAAALAGLGIAWMPDFLARDALLAGSLVTVLDAHVAPEGSLRILWPPQRQMTPRLRVFIDWASASLFS